MEIGFVREMNVRNNYVWKGAISGRPNDWCVKRREYGTYLWRCRCVSATRPTTSESWNWWRLPTGFCCRFRSRPAWRQRPGYWWRSSSSSASRTVASLARVSALCAACRRRWTHSRLASPPSAKKVFLLTYLLTYLNFVAFQSTNDSYQFLSLLHGCALPFTSHLFLLKCFFVNWV